MNPNDPFGAIERKRMYEASAVIKANPDLLKTIEARLAKNETQANSVNSPPSEREWPQPLAEHAFQGIAGELVRAIEPHTEADPAALLFQFLSGFGNLIGRAPHTVADAARHGCNIFTAIVGVSSKGRKGTAWNHIRRVLEAIDPEWTTKRVQSGLSSGEGLVWGVRDAIEKHEPIREQSKIVGYEKIISDPGVSDKRLMIIEQELAATLRVMSRDGSTLSTTIRQAWDTGDLRILTKSSPAQATGAHVSIIGHITRDELLRFLTSTDTANGFANGFANRFLWVCSRRSKLLPEGGNIQSVDFAPLIQRLVEVVHFSRNAGELQRDDTAREIWHEVYAALSEGKPGLLGTVTARSEPQVLRLALLYALLDGAGVISAPHMLAGLAAWDYCEASAKFIFGDSMGHPVADRILDAIRANVQGLTRTEIRDLLGRNQNWSVIQAALTALEERGLARQEVQQTGGRPTERWIAALPVTTKTT
jgi:hypothetical protein